MTDEKVFEDQLRRRAKRLGYYVEKSRIRDPEKPGYGGYMVIAQYSNFVVCGARNHAHSASLHEVAEFLDIAAEKAEEA